MAYKQNKKYVFYLTVLFVALFNFTVLSQNNMVRLSGQITSINGQAIDGVEVTFESLRYLRKVKTDETGKYTVNLPKAVYKMFTSNTLVKLKYDDVFYSMPDFTSYFRASTRASINLIDDSTINMILVESYTALWSNNPNGGGTGSTAGYSEVPPYYPVEFDTFRLAKNMEVVVQFSKREEQAGKVFYSTPLHPDFDSVFGKEFPFTVITNDKLTIYSKKVTYKMNSKMLEAENVFIDESGKERYKAKSIKINISGENVKIEIVK
jgi:hypothetical protein